MLLWGNFIMREVWPRQTITLSKSVCYTLNGELNEMNKEYRADKNINQNSFKNYCRKDID